ncbi:hypothetical protein JOY44_22090 [Phormidium sp. CLA17]|uniref:hypothetical protein n=1 Tax=Leptolyngbya sp. Cla-17 TaxID=2803751 RepID=UPI00149112E6|nr:hypothetical protein [Leptolyngbya sp. Cla-17]MBM0744269.1 hypothetical protein [Leptolyngbya sp. Cla-17]
MIETPSNLLDVFTLYLKTKETKSGKKLVSNLRTIFRKYLLTSLPGYTFNESDLSGKNLECCLSKIPISSFIEADPIAIFGQLSKEAISNNTIGKEVVRTTYNPTITNFIKWMQNQDWHTLFENVRHCNYAPKVVPKVTLGQARKGYRSHKANPYSLREDQLTSKLIQQIEDLREFCTAKEVISRQNKPMRTISFEDNIRRSILFFLGWLHKFEEWQLEELDIELMLTDGKESPTENLLLLKEFVSWGINTRGNGYGWGMMILKAPLSIAKWKYASESKRSMYRDIDLIERYAFT